MSTKYPGGFITKSPTAPNGTTAPGIWTLEQAAYYTKQGLWPSPPPPSDPYFDYVSLLLNGDGTNGAQNNTFTDSSTNSITLSRNGNLTQGSFNPYGSLWSNYFNGSSGYLTSPSNAAYTLGSSGDFTIDGWFYMTSDGGGIYPIVTNYGNWDTAYANRFYIGFASNVFRWYNSAGSTAISTSSYSLNTWNYFNFTRSGSTITGYLNGSVIGTQTTNQDYTTNDVLRIAGSMGNGNYFNGYISNVRIIKGATVSGTTVPTSSATAVSGTTFLSCQSNRFKDNSSNAFALTVGGSPQVQPFAPFNPTSAYSTTTNGGSGYFSSNSYINFTSSAAQVGGNTNFTFETWFYPVAGGSYGGGGSLIDIGGTNNGYFGLAVGMNGAYGLGIAMSSGSGWDFNNTFYSPFPLNQWYHVAVTRSSGTITAYVNGVSQGTGTMTNSKTGSENYIGYYTNFSSNYDSCYGYMAGYRLVVGSVVYTGNFTPPTTPPTAVANTALLPKFIGAGIFDYATQNNLQTVGNAQVSTSVKKYGTGSIAFDGSSSQLSYPSSVFGAGDFTVESWVYFNSTSGDQTVFGINFNASANSVSAVRVDISGGVFRFMGSTDGTNFYFFQATSTSPSTSTWYHIALVRSSGTVTFYVNGTSAGSVSSVPNALYAGTGGSRIGSIVYSSSNYLNGYVDDFRITDGIARYTANFTPPTEAFYTF